MSLFLARMYWFMSARKGSFWPNSTATREGASTSQRLFACVRCSVKACESVLRLARFWRILERSVNVRLATNEGKAGGSGETR
jgi:hypothetical protein